MGVAQEAGSDAALIRFEHVSCRFHHADGAVVQALDDVSVAIRDGEIVCLLGRSGHGKSTMLRALAGLQPLTSGRILVGGQQIMGPGADRGMVFQDDTVLPWLSVEANVEFGLRARGMRRDQRALIAQRWVTEVGLASFAQSWPKELSGGMRKRVAIAAAFANGAPILLMDEPFGPLDYVTRRDLQELLIGLWQESRKAIVFVTHDIEEALVLADRILVIRSGRVVDDIEVALRRPRDAEVRASRDAVNITKLVQKHLELDARTARSKGAALP